MKVFLSLPMGGKSEEDIMADIRYLTAYAKNYFHDEPIECIDAYFKFDINVKHRGLKYLALSIDKLADCDVALFAKNWRKANGCKIEHLCAQLYDIKIVEV